ncbi:unnamed protein product [Lepeophtheirus salmonis]|uniref:(salmon louse) hypothetical protein n=1 Tax=Lepeophtheirus salmonis TaxID=72036 RepID=A0A7R8H0I8_LEPSM|nr:unnamed protein product [Lepeophtheirus salmonis]CAF2769704.1 unnamed protein product [Lepeophtheirus salmonis]
MEEPETIIELIDVSMEKKSIESTIDKSICLSRATSQKKNCENYDYRTEILRYKVKLLNIQRILMREKRGKKINKKKLVKDFLLEKGHSISQVNFLMGKTNRLGNFSQDEIIDSLLLRTISLRAYKFLRQKKLMCLPAPSTLSNWIKDFRVNNGFLWNSLDQAEFAVPNAPVKCRSRIEETQDVPSLNQLEPTPISNEEEFEHHNSDDCISLSMALTFERES